MVDSENGGTTEPRGFSSPYFALGITFVILGFALSGTNAAFLTFGIVGVTFLIVAFSGQKKDGSERYGGDGTPRGGPESPR